MGGGGQGGEGTFIFPTYFSVKKYGNSNILCQRLYLQKNEHICGY